MSDDTLVARLRAEGKDWRENVGDMPLFDEAADALEASEAARASLEATVESRNLAREFYIAWHAGTPLFDAAAAWDDMGGSEPSYERAEWEIAAAAVVSRLSTAIEKKEA